MNSLIKFKCKTYDNFNVYIQVRVRITHNLNFVWSSSWSLNMGRTKLWLKGKSQKKFENKEKLKSVPTNTHGSKKILTHSKSCIHLVCPLIRSICYQHSAKTLNSCTTWIIYQNEEFIFYNQKMRPSYTLYKIVPSPL